MNQIDSQKTSQSDKHQPAQPHTRQQSSILYHSTMASSFACSQHPWHIAPHSTSPDPQYIQPHSDDYTNEIYSLIAQHIHYSDTHVPFHSSRHSLHIPSLQNHGHHPLQWHNSPKPPT